MRCLLRSAHRPPVPWVGAMAVLARGVSRGGSQGFARVNCPCPVVTARFPRTPGGVSGCETSWSNTPMTPADHGNDPLPPLVVDALRCSVCGDPIGATGRTLRCGNRHSFDLARQGYVNLLHARIPAGTADTAPMVTARADFLASGAYRALADELARVCAEADGLVIDAGAGTGYYLAHVLQTAPAAWGLALDVSAVALGRAARARPRLGAAVWNLWEPWPVGDEVASAVLNVF